MIRTAGGDEDSSIKNIIQDIMDFVKLLFLLNLASFLGTWGCPLSSKFSSVNCDNFKWTGNFLD